MNQCAVVDLFCGVGGLTHGFVVEGFEVLAGLDVDESCRYAYEQNNSAKFIRKDIKRVSGTYLSTLYQKDKIKILVGCAPCQPFSTYNLKKSSMDSRWDLIYEFLRVIKKLRPEIISMENVPQLTKKKVFSDFVKGLEKMNYRVSSSIVYCPDYGVPQKRRRLVLLASSLGEISLVPPTHTRDKYLTTRDAIGGLPPIDSGGVNINDPLH
ncbi:DNA (cytosine-5-)-methyltransferase, partial [Candidatus Micrarchaeota archaeon]|nr:DNA (cytosine-5-)-methyltransferase [Candidatus Micrarchaeota archaeon]